LEPQSTIGTLNIKNYSNYYYCLVPPFTRPTFNPNDVLRLQMVDAAASTICKASLVHRVRRRSSWALNCGDLAFFQMTFSSNYSPIEGFG